MSSEQHGVSAEACKVRAELPSRAPHQAPCLSHSPPWHGVSMGSCHLKSQIAGIGALIFSSTENFFKSLF